MTDIDASSRPAHASAHSVLANLRSAALNRRGLIVLAALAVGLGLTFNWNWLVAVGVAPLILALLPCAVMCRLGLCMAGHNHASAGAPTRSDGAVSDATADTERSCCSQTTARSK